jgi:hypothetical protein
MSKYQIFATPGSFRANQLKAPDESGKILEAAQQKIQGMERAQSFLEGNRELYLRAQRLAQNQEKVDRDVSYQLETQARDTYRKYLQQNNQTALENDRIAGQKTEQMYKDLSVFSNTAAQLVGQFEEQRKKKEQALATQLVLQAGLDYDQLTQLSSIDKKLSDSEFRQTEFMQGLIEQGVSEDRLRAIEQLRQRSPARVYLNTQAAYQNSLLSYQPALQEALSELGSDATPEQIKAKTQAFFAEFITNKFPGARPEMLESSGVLRSVRSINNQFVSQSSRDFAAKREAETKSTFRDDLQTTYNKEGLAGVMNVLQTNPKRWKREAFTDWAVAALNAGGPYGLSEEDGQAILEYQLTVGNQQVPFGKQFVFEGGRINEAIRASRRREVAEYNLRQNEEKMQSEAEMAQLFDSFAVDDDGRIDSGELAALEERAADLGLRDSEVLAYARANSVSAETDRAVERYLGEKADNLTLTIEDVNGLKMGTNLRRRFLQIAKEQAATRESPIYKSHIKSIEAAISQDPRVKAAPVTGASNYSVILMQDRYKQQYKDNLKRLGSPEEALSLTLQQIKTMQESPEAVNNEGRYTEIEQEVQRSASQAGKSLKEYQELLRSMNTPEFRKDAKYAVNSVGAANFYNSYNSMSKGGQPNAVIKSGAEMMGVDPLTFINYLAEGANVEPIKPLNDELQRLKESLPPITRRLYDTYRTPERVNRANSTTFGGVLPVRGNVSSNEKQALDYIAKYESESAGGYDAVNQGGAEGGTKVLGYSGPFSLMSQHGNRPLTSLTIAEIMALQADPGSSMSMQEWFNAGKLHAVGRYQFIGPTLASVVSQMGIDPNTQFTPDVQDKMALWLLRNSANGIGQWVGPANYATAQERALINAVR